MTAGSGLGRPTGGWPRRGKTPGTARINSNGNRRDNKIPTKREEPLLIIRKKEGRKEKRIPRCPHDHRYPRKGREKHAHRRTFRQRENTDNPSKEKEKGKGGFSCHKSKVRPQAATGCLLSRTYWSSDSIRDIHQPQQITYKYVVCFSCFRPAPPARNTKPCAPSKMGAETPGIFPRLIKTSPF